MINGKKLKVERSRKYFGEKINKNNKNKYTIEEKVYIIK